jgi:hypothetical protein
MKNVIALTIATGTLLLAGCSTTPHAKIYKQTYSSFDLPSEHPAQPKESHLNYDLQAVPLEEVLKIYGQVSGRTVVAGQLPKMTINLHNAKELSRIETLQMLDTVLAQNHIAMVLSETTQSKPCPQRRFTARARPTSHCLGARCSNRVPS